MVSISHYDAEISIAAYAGEVATLEHEVGDDTVEGGALVAETMLAGGELAEVLRRLVDNVIIELEDDAARGLSADGNVELEEHHGSGTGESRVAGKGRDGSGATRRAYTYEYVGHGEYKSRGFMET